MRDIKTRDGRKSLFVSSPKGFDDKIVREAAIQMIEHDPTCSVVLSQDLKDLDLIILGLLSADLVCFVGAWETVPECQLHWLVALYLEIPVYVYRHECIRDPGLSPFYGSPGCTSATP